MSTEEKINEDRQTSDVCICSSLRAVLADRERELLEVKGPCSHKRCCLHYAHSGPCNTAPRWAA